MTPQEAIDLIRKQFAGFNIPLAQAREALPLLDALDVLQEAVGIKEEYDDGTVS